MEKPSASAAEVVRRQRDGLHDDSTRSHGSLFHYATAKDRTILVLSAILAVIAGALNPLLTVVYGQLINAFNGFAAGTTKSSDLRSTIAQFTLYYVYCAIGIFVFIYIATVGFYYVGERVARALRRAHLRAVISQNMAFFDNRGNGEITVSIMSDMGTIQEAITSKISVAMTAMANFASAFVIMYVVSWRTALALSPTFLVMLGVVMVGGSYAVKHHKQAMGAQGQAATLAEESIASVREVTAFGIQSFLVAKYHSFLEASGRSDVKSRDSVTYMIAWSNAMPCLVYALSFWVGSIFLVKGQTSVSAIATTTLAIIISAFAIIRVAPSFQALTATVAGSSKILGTIARRSPQDPFSSEGKYLQNVAGEIAFRDVSLVYPSREEVVVLDRVNIRCPAGKTTAIVGPSGSGKSSVVSLLERYYEPTEGAIELDGHDLQTLNLRNLRSHVSIVEQEVALFDTTIFENIRYGLLNSPFQGTQEDLRNAVVQAATDANAHHFISELANGYDTMVGQAGTQLSGGQRQRIALARALIKQPSILLLDEATSALDSKSEAVVQQALESAAKNRTTIIVAHRLSTIRNADQIIVMEGGRVMEQGTHTELMDLDGLYAGLVQNQHVVDVPGQRLQEPSENVNSKLGISLHEKPVLQGGESAEDDTPAPGDNRNPETQERQHTLGLVSTLKFIYYVNAQEKGLLALGTASAIVAGFGIPIQSIFFAKLLDSLSLDPVALRQSVNFWSGLYVLMAGVAFIFWSVLGVAFARSTEALSRRAKKWALESILSQDIEFFDCKEHSTGALLEVVTGSTEQLSSLSGPVIGSVLTFLSAILTGIVISLVIGWKLALVCTATIPIVVACGWIRLRMLAVFDGQVKETGKEAASHASETVRLVRTVASLGIEEFALNRYDEILSQRAATSLRSMLSASALYAASQSVVFLCAALAFWYGGQLVSTGEYTVFQFYICFVALISGAQTAGSIFSYAPDASKAMHASHELQTLFASKSKMIATAPGDCHSGEEKQCTGGIQLELSDVDFRYPSRPDHQVLQNFNLGINKGQYLALVGPSGCGKSTILALLERFYDPDKGVVRVDGAALPRLNVQQHRQNVSLVSQGAALYSGTIRENIALGRRHIGDNEEETADEDIMDVCKQANIHDFICSLPDGLSTVLGPRGTLVSGGQRQRIAIARALIRQPQILLLDEATSALDPESERLVQDALDRAAEGRTTVSVAHRLSSIRAADIIYVVDAGRIVEFGNHGELMAMRGAYWDLVKMQNL